MRLGKIGLAVAAFGVLLCASAARADSAGAVRRFCLETEGREASFIAAASAAGWFRAPQEIIPEMFRADGYRAVMFADRASDAASDPVFVIISTPPTYVPQDGLLVEYSTCMLLVPELQADLEERFTKEFGPSRRRADGAPVWLFKMVDGRVRAAPELAGDETAIRDVLRTGTLMQVVLFVETGRADVLVAISRQPPK